MVPLECAVRVPPCRGASERGYRFIIALGPNGLKMDRSWAGGCACNADKCCKGLTETRGTSTGFSSEIGTKLCDWAVGQAWGSCYSWAALSSNDSKTRYSAFLDTLFSQDIDNDFERP